MRESKRETMRERAGGRGRGNKTKQNLINYISN